MQPDKADVVIVGAGVIGCFIARELSRYSLDVVLVEKESDVAEGATKANNGVIHDGMGEKTGTLKQKLNVKGNPMFDQVVEELDVPFNRCGLLILITKDSLPLPNLMKKIIPSFLIKKILTYLILRRGRRNNVPGLRVIDREELFEMEPNVTKRAMTAVFSPTVGVICPYRLTIALAENAVENGVNLLLNTGVKDIIVKDSRVDGVVTNKGIIKTRYVVNAAGVYADDVASMAGTADFDIHPRKGSLIIFDKDLEGYINHELAELKYPSESKTKGGALLQTTDGNLEWGPTAIEVSDKEDHSVSAEEIDSIIGKMGAVLPEVSRASIIRYFAGVRAATYEEDFVIEASEKVEGFVNVVGIQSPGLASAPAIAEMVLDILKEIGLPVKKKENFNPNKKKTLVFRDLSNEKKRMAVEDNPLYGNVVCRCEHVTEAEVVEAINASAPALTVDAVKRRTRAGMGRCQGGYCEPKVVSILASELKLPSTEVTKSGHGSNLLIGKTKSLLLEAKK